MANAYKILGQQTTAAGGSTYTTLYTPSGTSSAIISTISVCNQTSTAATYRIAVVPNSSAPSSANMVVYGATVNGNDTTFLTLGITLQNGATIQVYSSATTVSFSAFGSEIS